jgi:hypothetical protein
MPSLSSRENYLRALRHKETEYVPFNAMAHKRFRGEKL